MSIKVINWLYREQNATVQLLRNFTGGRTIHMQSEEVTYGLIDVQKRRHIFYFQLRYQR